MAVPVGHGSHGSVSPVAAVSPSVAAPTAAGDPVEEVDVALPEPGVHPPVDERVVGTRAHGQPVGADPHDPHVPVVPDAWVDVRLDVDHMERKPADTVDPDYCYHHFNHLRELNKKINSIQFKYFIHPI